MSSVNDIRQNYVPVNLNFINFYIENAINKDLRYGIRRSYKNLKYFNEALNRFKKTFWLTHV